MTLGDLIKTAEALRAKHGDELEVLVDTSGVYLGVSHLSQLTMEEGIPEWNIIEGDRLIILHVVE